MPRSVPVWPLKLIAFQLTVVYLATAHGTSCNPAFLSRRAPAAHAFMYPVLGCGSGHDSRVRRRCAHVVSLDRGRRRARAAHRHVVRPRPAGPLIPIGLALHALFWLGGPGRHVLAHDGACSICRGSLPTGSTQSSIDSRDTPRTDRVTSRRLREDPNALPAVPGCCRRRPGVRRSRTRRCAPTRSSRPTASSSTKAPTTTT